MSNHLLAVSKVGNCDDPALAEHADAIRRLGKRVVADVIEIGRRLVDCRDNHLEHGQWLPWLAREFGWSRQTADNFIHVFEAQNKLPNFGNLALPVSALYLLAAPSTPEGARDEIVERTQAGENLPVDEIKHIVEVAKGHTKRGWPRERWARHHAKKGGRKTRVTATAETVPIPLGDQSRHQDIGLESTGEIERKDARIEELQADKRRLEIENVGLRSEIEETKAARKPDGEGDAEGLGKLLRAWDRASHGAREKFKARVGLVAEDGLDVPPSLRRTAS